MKLNLYGQHTQLVVDKNDNSQLTLAVNYSGMTVFANKLVRNYFPWQMITKIHSNHKIFNIEVKTDLNANGKKKVYAFRMSDDKVNDAFLNLVIEHHIFFRLKDPNEMVFEKSMTYKGSQSFVYNGPTMHRKWSENELPK